MNHLVPCEWESKGRERLSRWCFHLLRVEEYLKMVICWCQQQNPVCSGHFNDLIVQPKLCLVWYQNNRWRLLFFSNWKVNQCDWLPITLDNQLNLSHDLIWTPVMGTRDEIVSRLAVVSSIISMKKINAYQYNFGTSVHYIRNAFALQLNDKGNIQMNHFNSVRLILRS